MKQLAWMAIGMAATLVACGGSGEPKLDPVPNPMPGSACAEEHADTTSDGHEVVVCDRLHAEAPFVRLPENTEGRVYAAIDGEGFVTAEGDTYAWAFDSIGQDPEVVRHATALYELTLDGERVESFRPVMLFPEEVFLKPLMGRAFEGTISRLVGEGQFSDETTLPVRLEVLAEPATPTTTGATYEARVVIANLDEAVQGADGTCLPALSSHGEEAPFPAGVVPDIRVHRVPSMHGFGDDELVVTFAGAEGVVAGSLMDPGWFLGPADLLRGTLDVTGTYSGFGHGTPGSLPNVMMSPVDGGGEACAAE